MHVRVRVFVFFFGVCVAELSPCIKRLHERRMRSAVAAVSSNAEGSKAEPYSRSDSRADRPRWYRPVRSARLRMCGSRWRRASVRARDSALTPTLLSFCARCAMGRVRPCVRACVRVCMRGRA